MNFRNEASAALAYSLLGVSLGVLSFLLLGWHISLIILSVAILVAGWLFIATIQPLIELVGTEKRQRKMKTRLNQTCSAVLNVFREFVKANPGKNLAGVLHEFDNGDRRLVFGVNLSLGSDTKVRALVAVLLSHEGKLLDIQKVTGEDLHLYSDLSGLQAEVYERVRRVTR